MADPEESEREGIVDGPPDPEEPGRGGSGDGPPDSDEREREPGATPDPADPALEGWWRYPPAAWIGLALAPPIVGVGVTAVGAVDGVVVGQALVLALVAALVGPGLALSLGSLLSFGTVFWGSMRYADDDAVDWNPSPWLYLVGAVVLTPLVAGGVWFVQRVRYVGVPEFRAWI